MLVVEQARAAFLSIKPAFSNQARVRLWALVNDMRVGVLVKGVVGMMSFHVRMNGARLSSPVFFGARTH